MDQDRLEYIINRLIYLKEEIERTYKRYIGVITDEKATIMDVAEFFNIPIDETRMEDYIIKSIDFDEPSIEICDTKNNTAYSANYTCKSDLLDTYGQTRFNNLKIHNPLAKVDSIYYIKGDTPICSKMSFTHKDCELTFKLENPHEEFFSNDGLQLTVQYSKNIDYEDSKVNEPLLTKNFKQYFKEGKVNKTFEQLFTYSIKSHIQSNDKQDKYTYTFKDNVIYGIQEHEEKISKNNIEGICFQNTNVSIIDYLPFNIYTTYSRYSTLKDNNLNSAIIFSGNIKSAENCRIWNNLEIYKINEDGIKIRYYANDSKNNEIFNVEFKLPIQTQGRLTLEELQSIVELLKTKFADDEFIAMILQELQIFDEKIRINEGLIQENLDALSPKLFINKSFQEIYDEITPNIDSYFDLAEKQFIAATNFSKPNEKEQTRALKINKNLQE